MNSSEENTFECSNCSREVKDTDEYCPGCGSLFLDVMCENHVNEIAEGACVICSTAYCKKCGGFYNNVFLCEEHSGYEIYQGMARIFGSSDFLQVEYAKDCLIKENFHPFIYCRKASPISLGGIDYTLYRPSGDYNGHIINELKIMVPVQEVLSAEKLLVELEII